MTTFVGDSFTPLNFNDVFLNENIVDPYLTQESLDIKNDSDLNPHLSLSESCDQSLDESTKEFALEDRFELLRSYHFDPSSLSSIEKYEALLSEEKKLYSSLVQERFKEIKTLSPDLDIDIDIDIDLDEMINTMFNGKKVKPASEDVRYSEQIKKNVKHVTQSEPVLNYVLQNRISEIKHAASCIFDMRNFISTCLKIKKRWNSFIEILCSSKPFLYGAACFVWKGCKGITIGLINLAPTFNLFTMNNINNGANEEKIVAPILQELQSLKERISKSEIQVVPSEDYKDKYYALLEKFQTLQDKRTAELEVEMAQKDKKNEKSHLKEKIIIELRNDTKEAHKVNEAVTKLGLVLSPVLSSSDYKKEKIMERRRSFSQPSPRLSLLVS